MKSFTYYAATSLVFFFLSCSGDSIKLYHPAEPEVPEYYWLLKTIGYPEDNPGFSARYSQEFTYTDDDLMRTIKSSDERDSTIVIDCISDKKVSFSRLIKQNQTTTYFDSLLIVLNDKKQAEYALHVRYTEKINNGESRKNITINDSTTFVYNAAGYMQQLDHYDDTGVASSLNYSEVYTVADGNITEISTSKNYKFIYTYDDKEHAAPSEYCYEMPRNTFNISASCWLMANLPFLSGYMGTRSKNNIIGAQIINTKDNRTYADIKYDYTFDENNLVSQIVMSGTTKYDKTFEGYTTTFTYIDKLLQKDINN
jgi:hypothetical protein